MGQMAGVLGPKPHLQTNDDLWKNYTLRTKIALAATKKSNFAQKKAYLSTGTINAKNELCFGTSALYQ